MVLICGIYAVCAVLPLTYFVVMGWKNDVSEITILCPK